MRRPLLSLRPRPSSRTSWSPRFRNLSGHFRRLGWPCPPGSLGRLLQRVWGAAEEHHLDACPRLAPQPRHAAAAVSSVPLSQGSCALLGTEGVWSLACRTYSAHTCVCVRVHLQGWDEGDTGARVTSVSAGGSSAAFCSLGSLWATWGDGCPQDIATPLPYFLLSSRNWSGRLPHPPNAFRFPMFLRCRNDVRGLIEPCPLLSGAG